MTMTTDLTDRLQDTGIDYRFSWFRDNREAGRLMLEAAERIRQLEFQVSVLRGSLNHLALPYEPVAYEEEPGGNVIPFPGNPI